jgi:hypothetical protein
MSDRHNERYLKAETREEEGSLPDVFTRMVGVVAAAMAEQWGVLRDPRAVLEGHITLEPRHAAQPWKITLRVETATPEALAEMEQAVLLNGGEP